MRFANSVASLPEDSMWRQMMRDSLVNVGLHSCGSWARDVNLFLARGPPQLSNINKSLDGSVQACISDKLVIKTHVSVIPLYQTHSICNAWIAWSRGREIAK